MKGGDGQAIEGLPKALREPLANLVGRAIGEGQAENSLRREAGL